MRAAITFEGHIERISGGAAAPLPIDAKLSWRRGYLDGRKNVESHSLAPRRMVITEPSRSRCAPQEGKGQGRSGGTMVQSVLPIVPRLDVRGGCTC